MNKRLIFILIVVSVLNLSILSPLSAAVKLGSPCKKVGQTSSFAGKNYVCIKSGSQTVWKIDTKINSLGNTTTSNKNLEVSNEAVFSPISDCKLQKPNTLPMDDGPMGSIGFPKESNAIPSLGNQKSLLLFIEFPDVLATNNIKKIWESSSVPNAENLFYFSSYGKLKLKVEFSEKIYRLDKQSTYYNLTTLPSGGPDLRNGQPKLDEVISDALTAADPDVDYSQYAFVTVATPSSSSLSLGGATGLGPNPKKFDGVTYTKASFQPLSELTPTEKRYKTYNFTHDIGHMMGLMHPYVDEGPVHGAWDIMWNFAFQNDFLGWNKWKLNWLSDAQVDCISEGKRNITQYLTPIGSASNTKKMIVIKLNESSALVIESRRKTIFENLKTSDEGIIVYKIDTTKAQGFGPVSIISNQTKILDSQNFACVLGTMGEGEFTTSDGYKIKVLKRDTGGDYVLIS